MLTSDENNMITQFNEFINNEKTLEAIYNEIQNKYKESAAFIFIKNSSEYVLARYYEYGFFRIKDFDDHFQNISDVKNSLLKTYYNFNNRILKEDYQLTMLETSTLILTDDEYIEYCNNIQRCPSFEYRFTYWLNNYSSSDVLSKINSISISFIFNCLEYYSFENIEPDLLMEFIRKSNNPRINLYFLNKKSINEKVKNNIHYIEILDRTFKMLCSQNIYECNDYINSGVFKDYDLVITHNIEHFSILSESFKSVFYDVKNCNGSDIFGLEYESFDNSSVKYLSIDNLYMDNYGLDYLRNLLNKNKELLNIMPFYLTPLDNIIEQIENILKIMKIKESRI